MIYSDTSTKQGIVQDIDFLVDSNSDIYPINDKTRNVNKALDDFVSLAISADGRWQFDDSNYTEYPIGTTDLENGRQDYQFEEELLVVTRVECKDEDGKWYKLTSIDQEDVDTSLTDFEQNNGKPLYYDKIADSVFLYPTPNYDGAESLKVYYKRKADYFLPSDTTKEPGIPSHLHKYLSTSAALEFALAKGKTQKITTLGAKLQKEEEKIKNHYSKRSRDEEMYLYVNEVNPY